MKKNSIWWLKWTFNQKSKIQRKFNILTQVLPKMQYSMEISSCSIFTNSAILNSMFSGKFKIYFSTKVPFNWKFDLQRETRYKTKHLTLTKNYNRKIIEEGNELQYQNSTTDEFKDKVESCFELLEVATKMLEAFY